MAIFMPIGWRGTTTRMVRFAPQIIHQGINPLAVASPIAEGLEQPRRTTLAGSCGKNGERLKEAIGPPLSQVEANDSERPGLDRRSGSGR